MVLNRRTELQAILEKTLGSRNVYYQPTATVNMDYPAIKYAREHISTRAATNSSDYLNDNKYQLTVISRKPDNPVIDKLLTLPYCSYDRHYVSENLHHDILTIYF